MLSTRVWALCEPRLWQIMGVKCKNLGVQGMGCFIVHLEELHGYQTNL